MRSWGFLIAVTLIIVTSTMFGWSESVAGQEPPVGNPPEEDDEVMREIAELLLTASSQSASGSSGIEEDPELWHLASQLEPDLIFTLGDQQVGGIAELPDVMGTLPQTADPPGPNLPIVAGIVAGLAGLAGTGWYMSRRAVRES